MAEIWFQQLPPSRLYMSAAILFAWKFPVLTDCYPLPSNLYLLQSTATMCYHIIHGSTKNTGVYNMLNLKWYHSINKFWTNTFTRMVCKLTIIIDKTCYSMLKTPQNSFHFHHALFKLNKKIHTCRGDQIFGCNNWQKPMLPRTLKLIGEKLKPTVKIVRAFLFDYMID